MPVSLSLKDVPDDLAEALRQQAKRNHRSLQGEMMHILDTAVRPKPFRAMALLREIQKLGLKTESNSTDIIRKARDRR
jgi:plasmid stability protein